MAKLIYVANVSLDGYIEDAHGSFEWTAPIDEVFTFITDLVRPVGAYLYGRRMYETMAVWETQPALAAQSALMADFANVGQAADKIVYSTTLHVLSTANTRLERRFDPDSVRDMKTSAVSDLTVGGPTLAAHAFNAGLVDEFQLFMSGPVREHRKALTTATLPRRRRLRRRCGRRTTGAGLRRGRGARPGQRSRSRPTRRGGAST